jgi:hypothetical protein
VWRRGLGERPPGFGFEGLGFEGYPECQGIVENILLGSDLDDPVEHERLRANLAGELDDRFTID